MYEFRYDYIKPRYQYNAKLCYMDTDSFIIHIKNKDVYEGNANDLIHQIMQSVNHCFKEKNEIVI